MLIHMSVHIFAQTSVHIQPVFILACLIQSHTISHMHTHMSMRMSMHMSMHIQAVFILAYLMQSRKMSLTEVA